MQPIIRDLIWDVLLYQSMVMSVTWLVHVMRLTYTPVRWFSFRSLASVLRSFLFPPNE